MSTNVEVFEPNKFWNDQPMKLNCNEQVRLSSDDLTLISSYVLWLWWRWRPEYLECSDNDDDEHSRQRVKNEIL